MLKRHKLGWTRKQWPTWIMDFLQKDKYSIIYKCSYINTFNSSCDFSWFILLQHKVVSLVEKMQSKLDSSAFYCTCNVNTYQQYNVWLSHFRKYSLKAFSPFAKIQRRCMMSSRTDHRKQIFLKERAVIYFFTAKVNFLQLSYLWFSQLNHSCTHLLI